MEVKKILIHIGYQKTGTTWLQKHFFNNDLVGFSQPFTSVEIDKALIYPLPLGYNSQQCSSQLFPNLIKTQKRNLVPVISRERLSGSLRGGGYDSVYLADRLLAMFPQAKILLVIREQKAMIYSSYKQMVKGGYSLTLRELLGLEQRDKQRLHLFDLSRFEYHHLIEYYFSLFGRDQVLVLPYELFRGNPKQFIGRISSFCQINPSEEIVASLPYQIKENDTYSGAATASQRIINRWFVKDLEFNPTTLFSLNVNFKIIKAIATRLDRLLFPPLKKHYDSKYRTLIARKVKDRYRESNLITSNLINIDLKQYGYDLVDN